MREGWKLGKLGDFSAINYGYTAKATFENVGPKFLRITDIQNGNVDWREVPNCQISQKEFERHVLHDKDIVFARTGATTGKSFLLHDPPQAVAASYLIRLRVENPKALPEFVALYFQSKDYWDTVFKGMAGSAQGGFNASKLKNLRLPIPPLPEQKRIVAILDEAFAGIERAVANTEKNFANARELFESYLCGLFTHSGESCPQKRLSDICAFSSGGTPSKKDNRYWAGDIPWVSGRDMKSTQLFDSQLHISRVAVDESATRIGPVGSLLVLVRGMGLAHGAQIAELMVPCAFNQDIKAIHPKPNLISRYLVFALRNKINSADNVLSNAAHGTLKINSEGLKNILIPVPSKESQGQIVSDIDVMNSDLLQLESIYQQKLAALSELKQSLLQKAFSGELTADPEKALKEVAA